MTGLQQLFKQHPEEIRKQVISLLFAWKILVHHSTCVQGVSNAAEPLSVLICFTRQGQMM